MKGIRTSHVGSFPLNDEEGAIPKVMMDLKDIGLDIPPYPQIRSFIDIFLDPLADKGILRKEGDFFYTDAEMLMGETPQADVPEAVQAVKALEELGLVFQGLRGPVTGPFTLASRVYLSSDVNEGLKATALARKELVRNFFVPYVASGLRLMHSLGYTHIFIDEPVLGVIVGRRRVLFGYSEEDIKEVIDTVFEGLSDRIHGIHVCGIISKYLFHILSQVDSLDILNFEFHDSRPNLKVVDHELLESGGKILAPGVASSKKPVVEPVEDILNLLKQVYVKADGQIDLVSADCGFGGLGGDDPQFMYMVSLKKLGNIVKAVKILNESGA